MAQRRRFGSRRHRPEGGWLDHQERESHERGYNSNPHLVTDAVVESVPIVVPGSHELGEGAVLVRQPRSGWGTRCLGDCGAAPQTKPDRGHDRRAKEVSQGGLIAKNMRQPARVSNRKRPKSGNQFSVAQLKNYGLGETEGLRVFLPQPQNSLRSGREGVLRQRSRC